MFNLWERERSDQGSIHILNNCAHNFVVIKLGIAEDRLAGPRAALAPRDGTALALVVMAIRTKNESRFNIAGRFE